MELYSRRLNKHLQSILLMLCESKRGGGIRASLPRMSIRGA